MSSTISPTANARFPFEICASFGRNGAPAGQAQQQQADSHRLVQPQDSRECEGGERHDDEVRHERQSVTSRQLRSGATISLTRSPRPMPSMLETTNTIMLTEMAACFRSMRFSRSVTRFRS